METKARTAITVKATVNAPVEKVWKYWNEPAQIIKWCTPGGGWHTPRSENDLRVGGTFLSRMEAEDGSMGFDFSGVYDTVETNELIEYTMGDGRKCKISFKSNGDTTEVVETFDAEEINPVEMQEAGWQAILDNFKKYTEAN